MSWSEAQLQAIRLRDKNILVAAAAGSGKTSVLVERIIQRLLDPVQPIDVNQILVVTFTNAAAAEMRSRVGVALQKALTEQRGQTAHIERQLVLLHSAQISTIHAFCQQLVRQHFHLLDIDPQFRIANDAEMTLMKQDVLTAVCEASYAVGDGAFLALVDQYGEEKSDEALHQLVLGLYEASRSHPWPEAWLQSLPAAFDLPLDAAIDATPWAGLIAHKVRLELEGMRDWLLELSLAADELAPVYSATLAEDWQVLQDVLTAVDGGWDGLAAALTEARFGKMPNAPKGMPDDVKKYFQNGRQKVKDKVNDVRTLYFEQSAADWLADMRKLASVISALTALVERFAAAFAAAKRAKGVLDFSDLEHFCLQVLREPGSTPADSRPSAVAAELQARFAEIMVDEYQDTNGVQESMLRLLARPDQPNLFLVGDVKQSIYRFRLAEPELFLAKYHAYPQAGDGCARVDLAQNFRSRPGVLAAVNFLFGQLLVPSVAELSYGEAEALHPGPDYPAADGRSLDDPVEICLIDREDKAPPPEDGDGEDFRQAAAEAAELSGFELEARWIAQAIQRLMTEERQVYDKSAGGYRRLSWRDIVILLRSVRGKADVLLTTLREAGIPVYAELDSGYFRETEVQVMLALLSCIDNPRQDIPLAGVLRSPLVGLTAAELAEIRLLEPQGDLWDAVELAVQDKARVKLQRFWQAFTHWRNLARRDGVPVLIWDIYRQTGYYDYVGSMPGGMVRQANLRALYDRARQFEATYFRGLFRFLRFIERMQDKGSDLAVARTLGESEDVVRVMSIHKSKGLEFPVVIVGDLGKPLNLQDSRASVLCHKTLGLGPYVVQPEWRLKYPSLARHGISHKLIMETKAEELRILYVALTRAREKLILVGSVKRLGSQLDEWNRKARYRATTLAESAIAGAKHYLDWIMPAVLRHPDSQPLGAQDWPDDLPLLGAASHWRLTTCRRAELARPPVESGDWPPLLAEVEAGRPVPDGGAADWVAATLGWQYAYPAVVSKPAKLSVTELKRRFEQVEPHTTYRLPRRASISLRPRFVQERLELTGAERGTLLHSVMQHLDLQGDLSAAGVAAQLEQMVYREVLLPEHAPLVDTAAVAAFFAGTLGQRMLQSPLCRRELPFSLLLPAKALYADMADQEEGIFVQGVIDALFDEGDGLVLLDYKTDKESDGAALAERYQFQLSLYADAIETILQKPVRECYLYALQSQQVIAVPRLPLPQLQR